jgi:hypothetical protein
MEWQTVIAENFVGRYESLAKPFRAFRIVLHQLCEQSNLNRKTHRRLHVWAGTTAESFFASRIIQSLSGENNGAGTVGSKKVEIRSKTGSVESWYLTRLAEGPTRHFHDEWSILVNDNIQRLCRSDGEFSEEPSRGELSANSKPWTHSATRAVIQTAVPRKGTIYVLIDFPSEHVEVRWRIGGRGGSAQMVS